MLLSLLFSSVLTVVELNTENLFDCQHDSLKRDEQFLPSSAYRWTPARYWRKLDRIGQEIIACVGDSVYEQLPDLVALCEVENDSVMRDLTQRSLLRGAGYKYVMTSSPDIRGIDVALLYSPFTFRLLCSYAIRIDSLKGFSPTRDILYSKGETLDGDTLHVFVVHAPSKRNGEKASLPYRLHVARKLTASVDSVRGACGNANIIVMGDFNDYSSGKSLQLLTEAGLTDVSARAVGSHGAEGTYRYRGEWGNLDHIFVSGPISGDSCECYVFDAPFLLVEDEKYGGVKPRRNYQGPVYLNGFSDHLPLVAKFRGRKTKKSKISY